MRVLHRASVFVNLLELNMSQSTELSGGPHAGAQGSRTASGEKLRMHSEQICEKPLPNHSTPGSKPPQSMLSVQDWSPKWLDPLEPPIMHERRHSSPEEFHLKTE